MLCVCVVEWRGRPKAKCSLFFSFVTSFCSLLLVAAAAAVAAAIIIIMREIDVER